MANGLIYPDIVGSFQQGQRIGAQNRLLVESEQRRSRLADLAQRAYGAQDATQRQGLIGQAVGVDPEAGFAMGKQFSAQEDERTQRLVNNAKLLTSAPEAMRPALWQQVRGSIAQSGIIPESSLPLQYDDTVAQTAQALVQAYGGMQPGGKIFAQKIGDDGFIYNAMADGTMVNTGVKADRQMWFRDHPGMPPELVDKSGAIRPVGVPQPVAGGGEVPFMVDPNLPPEVQADIRANEGRGQAWTGQQPVPAMRAMARPSEGQTAAEVEAAKSATELQYLPEAERIKRESAIAQARGIADVKREAELAEQAPKRVKQYEQALQASKNVMTSIDKALGMIGPLSTGFLGARSRGIEGSPAYNLAAEIETVKANLGFDRLQQMRDNSPTGGALGAIAVQELIALQSTIANLDPNQGDEQLRQNLERVQTHYRNWQNAVQQALADENRQAAPVAPQQGRTALPPGFSWED